MSQKDDEVKDVLHSLDHQKWEAIGVEELAREASATMSMVMVVTKLYSTSLAQDMATMWALKELMEMQLCDDCISLASRIKNQIVSDYEKWKIEHQESKR